MPEILLPPSGQYLREQAVRGAMDLLFLANSRHLNHTDGRLYQPGLGRAHIRILYFVARQHDVSKGELLQLLAIKKQSLRPRVHELVELGYLEENVSKDDRRRRLLRLTVAGHELMAGLFTEMEANVRRAYDQAGGTAVSGFWTVMQHLIGPDACALFRRLQSET